ncbi:P-loop ATPase, Sll1717 family [Brevundimonas sp.]|jgi:hypothetical protein|uniref:P-loop ATPase, Sll1717 family n=1 Tax=Brevundimonas sp. TaxID=1871086 RepID=UPI003784907E
MIEVFVAYASGNDFHGSMIRKACEGASTPSRKLLPWSDRDTSGFPIAQSVEDWIERADSFIGDVSTVNDNVTFEVGLAIGLGKPCRFIRSTHVDFTPTKNIGLLDTLGHDEYGYESQLERTLKKNDTSSRWPDVPKLKNQPLFVLQPPTPLDWSVRLNSAVKKTARLRFRGFNPSEISRLSALEAYEQVMSSYGVISCWSPGQGEEARRNNQRASFVHGLAKGRGIPCLLIAREGEALPLDLNDIATRWKELSDFDKIISRFRDEVADLQNDFIETKSDRGNILDQVTCGDPTAENEAAGLSQYFLETEGFQKALNGEASVLVGRKGSGKTAVFIRVRDRTRTDKSNIIIDLIPDGYQLVKMKEYILDQLGHGARKEVISAFWEYVLWLEIAYKLIEKDEQKAYRDPALLVKFEKLQALFNDRVDTGAGDFSERLKRLTSSIVARFEAHKDDGQDIKDLKSSHVLRIIYGEDIKNLRATVLDYLRIKGFVFFMVDNLDRFWTPGGFTDDDALIVVGLIESMQEITRKFRNNGLDFRWSIFVRSDVYEFLVRGMADYGKLAVQSLEWSDRDLLKVMFERRVLSAFSNTTVGWRDLWGTVSDAYVSGKPVLDFLVDGSLMRPRYLIRLFETARRRAITFGRSRIVEQDYSSALKELGWQVIEDLDREIADLIPNGSDLLFEIIHAGEGLTVDKFRYVASKKLTDPESVNRLLEVMLWNGSLGVCQNGQPKYIFDCGYKRQYLTALIEADSDARLYLHPTLRAALA